MFWNQCQAMSAVTLKEGAQVMLLKNLDLGSQSMLVNGSRGVIVGFETDVRRVLFDLLEYYSSWRLAVLLTPIL